MTYSSFLPDYLVRLLADRHDVLPLVQRADGVAMFADIVGFTPMSAALADVGPEGTEELSEILNSFFARMIDLVTGHGATAADVDRWWRCFLRRFDLEIVCTQVTKPRLGAAWCGRDHIADLHLAVGDHHPVDQQLHQLAALLEASLAEPRARPLQHLGHRPGGRAYLDQSLTLGGDLSLAGQQVRLLPGKGPVLALEAGQVDHLGQVGLQQALPLACHARPDTAQGRLPAAQLLGHPGAAVRAFQRLGDLLGLLQDRAQIRPHQLVEPGGGAEPRRAGLQAAGGHLRLLAAAAVVAVPGIAGAAGDPLQLRRQTPQLTSPRSR